MVTAHECGLADQIEKVDVGTFVPMDVHEAVASDNPLGRIPALVLDDGATLYDSRVICEWLADKSGNKELLPSAGDARWRILTLQALGQGLADGAVQTRYEVGLRPEHLRWPELVTRQMQRFEDVFDALAGPWRKDLDQVTLGSIAAAVVLSYIDFRYPDVDWRTGRADLAAWHAKFSERPSMVATAV